jgi:hypothetical protein
MADSSKMSMGTLLHVAASMKGKAASARTIVADVKKAKRRAEFVIFADSSEQWIWVKDEQEAFLPAKIIKENPDGSMEVEMNVTNAIKLVRKGDLGPRITRLAELKNNVDGEYEANAAIRCSNVHAQTLILSTPRTNRHGAHGRRERSDCVA